MKIVFDTSFIISLERGNKESHDLVKELFFREADFFISTITVSEIMTGVYLKENFRKSFELAKDLLSQFIWKDFDSEIAIKSGEIIAFLLTKGERIEFQDVAIASTALKLNSDYLVTENKKHFERIPALKSKVFSSKELLKKI
ncbi:MAG TPA: type II toxin-antitoxin system VapC family toxin [archaeon]|nr:type II toxin-antitoxin system VapC family toxin [archaeon]